ncbi:MAG: hypothetical protein K8F25_17570, partial [Fimbriimonadaceae bacterium]|nr:hypothetical protein [Alphaproteobacteria bacterium]
AQDCIVTEVDCGSEEGLTVQPVVDSGEVIASLGHRILGRTAAADIVDPESGEVIIPVGTLIEESHVEKVENANVQQALIRSALTCKTKIGVCAACYGRDLARGTPVNIGEAVGVIAAQSIGEPGTQLTMRTFHIGGTAQVVDQSYVESNFDGTIKVRNRDVVKDSNGNLIAMGRNMAIVVQDKDGAERAVHRIVYGARMRVDEGDKVERGQRLAEWDPYTRPILTEVGGIVEFEDLVEGASVVESFDEATGITKRVVIDWRTNTRGADLRPALIIKDKKGEIITLERGVDARYLLSVDAIISADSGATVHAGDVIARIPMESAKTRDITGGLPRVAELFEARRPKDHAIIAEVSGEVKFGRDYKNKRRIAIIPPGEDAEPVEFLIPKGRHLHVQEGDFIEKGEYILDGHPAPHDILAVSGVEALAAYLISEIQDVYRLQGVTINDKHIEVIVRQMLQKVEVTDPGDTELLMAEQIDRVEFDEVNAAVTNNGRNKKKPAQGAPVLLGITKASLQTRSFISAASFQETTRVLTEAAVYGKVDTLEGLKENVIVGRLIPAGTGSVISDLRAIATKRDALIQVERAKTAAAAVEAARETALIESKPDEAPAEEAGVEASE